MLEQAFAQQFSQEWLAAWNSHDLAQVLSHYADDFEMHSPMIARIAGEPSGRLKGKQAVGAYWAKALAMLPDLRFELVAVLVGVDSLVIQYLVANNTPAAEVFHFGPDHKVVKAFAHYGI